MFSGLRGQWWGGPVGILVGPLARYFFPQIFFALSVLNHTLANRRMMPVRARSIMSETHPAMNLRFYVWV